MYFFSRSYTNYFRFILGSKDFARSTIFIEGIFGTIISPPIIFLKVVTTRLTAWSKVIQNLVIFYELLEEFFVHSIKLLKYGATEPLDPTTFPYLTTENFVSWEPAKLLAVTKSLSEANLVAP